MFGKKKNGECRPSDGTSVLEGTLLSFHYDPEGLVYRIEDGCWVGRLRLDFQLLNEPNNCDNYATLSTNIKDIAYQNFFRGELEKNISRRIRVTYRYQKILCCYGGERRKEHVISAIEFFE